MRYISLFSGIEAASVAWAPLGWEPLAFAEIEPFCCEPLEKRFPGVPNLGDVCGVDWSAYRGKRDLIIGGSPCQAFSVAGRREGLDDPRGRLMLEYARAVGEVEPRWVLWENVPGVLSQDGGAAFGTLLGVLEDCGYSLAWRVPDAQFFGVPQRRRRVFLVGHTRAQCAAAVLFEPESLQGSAPSSADKRAELAAGAGRGASCAGFIAGVSPRARGVGYAEEQLPTLIVGQTAEVSTILGNAIGRSADAGPNGFPISDENVSPTLATTDRRAVAYGMRADTTPKAYEEIRGTVTRGGEGGSNNLVREPPCFAQNQRDEVRLCGGDGKVSGALSAQAGAKQQSYVCIADLTAHAAVDYDLCGTLKVGGGEPVVMKPSFDMRDMRARRLTPTECERLQGFPDGWTDIRDATPDTPRWQAPGNSMAVPVIRWLGERMQAVDEIEEEVYGGR